MKIRDTKQDPRKLGCRCAECPLRDEWPLLPRTPRMPRAVVVSERPSYQEAVGKRKEVGVDSEWTAAAMRLNGYTLEDAHPVRLMLCRPSRKLTPEQKKRAIAACAPRFEAELQQLRKSTDRMVVLGSSKFNSAMKAVTGFGKPQDWWGTQLEGKFGFKVVPAPHPSEFQRYPQLVPFLATCLKRGVEAPTFQTWPEPELQETFEAQKILRRMQRERCWVGVDVETRGVDPYHAPLLTLALAATWGGVSLKHPVSPEFHNIIQDILLNNPIVMHNHQHDVPSLIHQGGYEVKCDFDTMLAHAVVHFEAPHDLGLVGAWYLFMRRWKTEHKEGKEKGDERFFRQFNDDPIGFKTYNYADAWVTVMLQYYLQRELEEYHRGVEIFRGYMESSADALKMREYGTLVSRRRIREHRHELLKTMAKVRSKFNSLVRGKADLGISGQSQTLHTLFFETFKLEPLALTDEGKEVLDARFLTNTLKHPHPQVRECAELVLAYRRAHKLYSVYLTGVENALDDRDRMHPTFNVHGAISGRWSSKRPNFLNFPKSMRDICVAPLGRKIVTADYKTLEVKILALLAGAEKLLRWFVEGLDVHTLNAKSIFAELMEAERRLEVTEDERSISKGVMFGSLYGGDPVGLHAQLVSRSPGIRVSDVRRAQEAIFTTHPEIPEFQERLVAQAQRDLFVEEILSGRRRHFFGRVKPTEVLNFPIQGFGGELMRRACRKIVDRLEGTDCYLINQVYDSAYLEGPEEKVGFMVQTLKDCMEQSIKLHGHSLTFTIDVGVGDNMKDMEET